MKDKWKAFFAFLGIIKVESNADGIFLSEADVDKMNAVHTENETLRTAAQTTKDAHTAAIADKDTQISKLTGEKATLTQENERLTEELARAQAGGIQVEKAKDPAPNTTVTRKLSKNERNAEKTAAMLRGEVVDTDDDDEEEGTRPENKTKE